MKNSNFVDCPNDAKVVIFSYLNEKNLCKIREVNKNFKEIASMDFLWKNFKQKSVEEYINEEKKKIKPKKKENSCSDLFLSCLLGCLSIYGCRFDNNDEATVHEGRSVFTYVPYF